MLMQQLSRRLVPYILIVSIVTAAFIYLTDRYNGLTLILVHPATAVGTGKAYWDSGSGFSEKNSATFTVAGSQDGSWQSCNVHLPATGVKSLRIVPLTGTTGAGQIRQISLLNDNIRYFLNADGSCQQQPVGSGQARTVACTGDYPRTGLNADASVTVSDIPMDSMEIPLRSRIGISVIAFMFMLVGGIWLVRLPEGITRREMTLCYLGRAAWLALASFYLLQLYRLSRYAVDVPYIDEWHYFDRDALPEGLTWRWLFAFHNEHRILPTKLMAWLNLKLFGLDFVKQQLVNYLLYGALIAAAAKLKQRILGSSFRLFPVFLFFLLSPINYENHAWGFQSQFHLVVIFALLTIYHAFEDREYLTNYFLFAAFVLLGAYSFSAGVVLGLILILCQTAFFVSEKIGKKQDPPPDFRRLLLPTTLIAIGLACWFIGYQKPEHHPPLTLPFSSAFWDYFLNVLSCAFGYTGMSDLPGIVCLVLVITPVIMLWRRSDSTGKSGRWKITAAILATLAILAIISIGRSGLGDPKSSRYTEFGLLLIPFASIAWYMALSPGKLRNCTLTLFWLFCACSSAPYWTDFFYREDRVNKLSRLDCVERYLSGSGDGNCEEEVGDTIGTYIDAATLLNTKFTRQFINKE